MKARIAIPALLAVATLAVLAIQRQPPPICTDLNVALIVLDAAGVRHLSGYGNPRPTTPNIDRILAGATRFERAYAQAPATVKSMSSLLTGKYAPSVESTEEPFKLENERTLAMLLEGAGYRTAAFSQNPWISRTFGFANGFQTFAEISGEPVPGRPLPNTAGAIETPFTKAVTSWIDEPAKVPFFLYAHLLAPHSPYTPPKPFAGSFDPNYAGKVRDFDVYATETGKLVLTAEEIADLRLAYEENLAYADAQAGAILHHLDDLGLFDDTLIILTGDHGEAFFEHGRMMHGTTLYDEMLRVPLFIHWPACLATMPARYPHPAELRQLYATIADALDIAGTDRSGSFLAALRTPDAPQPVRADASDPFTHRHMRMVVRGGFKLIETDPGEEEELYDLSEDPRELHNIAGRRPDLVAELRPILQASGDEIGSGEVPEIDAATREKLRGLGYQIP